MQRFLLVDVGNTQMVFGVYQHHSLQVSWRLSSTRLRTVDELAWELAGQFELAAENSQDFTGILVGSVVPHLDATLLAALQRVCLKKPALVGDPDVRTGMVLDYKNPREVGADRIANAVAARHYYGSPVIVMDCGTATTFDMVSEQGHYAGGLILPGIEIALEALCSRAARLSEVSMRRLDLCIGRDTVSSIQAGHYWASVDALRGLIRRLRTIEAYEHAPVVATGGQAHLLLADIPEVDHECPNLTLDGLFLLAQRHFC